MNFELNEDQRSLQAVLREALSEQADSAALRSVLESETGWDEQLWKTLATDLGVVGLTVPEELGGAGAGLVELAVVQEALGERLAAVPYLATVLATETVLACASAAQQQEWLPAVCSGELLLSLAVAEGAEAWQVAETTVLAEPAGDVWNLTGHKDHLLAAGAATAYLVPAQTHDGVRMFRVDADTAGVYARADEALDPARPTGSLILEGAPAQLLGDAGQDTVTALEQAHRVASLALAAEQVGGMQRCLDLAVEHAATRVQFDRPIGGFQAIKHRCADMYVLLATSRAVTRYAAWSLQSGSQDADVALHLAQAQTAEAYYRVARDNIQVQGGIGCTWEHDAHLHLKRAVTSRVLLGSTSQARARSAQLLGF